jgi:hypothetical protein
VKYRLIAGVLNDQNPAKAAEIPDR